MIYSIGQVEELTGIKAHVIRYWEEVISFWNPRKDNMGKRVYTQSDIAFIFRLKYLITIKKFTVQGAGRQILNEAITSQNKIDTIKAIRECRLELSKTYFKIQECFNQT